MDDTGRDNSVQRLVSDFWKGYLTRRGFFAKAGALGLSAATATGLLGAPTVAKRASAQGSSPEVRPGSGSRAQAGAGYGGTMTRWAASTS